MYETVSVRYYCPFIFVFFYNFFQMKLTTFPKISYKFLPTRMCELNDNPTQQSSDLRYHHVPQICLPINNLQTPMAPGQPPAHFFLLLSTTVMSIVLCLASGDTIWFLEVKPAQRQALSLVIYYIQPRIILIFFKNHNSKPFHVLTGANYYATTITNLSSHTFPYGQKIVTSLQ